MHNSRCTTFSPASFSAEGSPGSAFTRQDTPSTLSGFGERSSVRLSKERQNSLEYHLLRTAKMNMMKFHGFATLMKHLGINFENVFLEFLNTAAKVQLFRISKYDDEISKNGAQIVITWHYNDLKKHYYERRKKSFNDLHECYRVTKRIMKLGHVHAFVLLRGYQQGNLKILFPCVRYSPCC
jgi:hypothetical protein